MSRYVLMFEYDSKKFMNVDKIIQFQHNLKLIEEKNNSVNLVFYGDATNEEFATFMGYFNTLVKKKVCDIAISFKTNEIIVENGINNKSIKLSAKNAKEIKDRKFDNLIKGYYSEDLEIKILPTKDWENIVLDLIGA